MREVQSTLDSFYLMTTISFRLSTASSVSRASACLFEKFSDFSNKGIRFVLTSGSDASCLTYRTLIFPCQGAFQTNATQGVPALDGDRFNVCEGFKTDRALHIDVWFNYSRFRTFSGVFDAICSRSFGRRLRAFITRYGRCWY